MMMHAVLHAPNLLRYQVAAMIAATIFPLVVNLLYLTRIVPMLYDLTPITFALSGLVLSWGLFRYRLFDLVPVARGAMVDRVSDGMLVVDAMGRVGGFKPRRTADPERPPGSGRWPAPGGFAPPDERNPGGVPSASF